MKKEDEFPNGYLRVTEVLSAYSNLGHIAPETLAKAADRGSRVHKYCENHALGLFVAKVDDDCKNYFQSFEEWFDKYVERVLLTETRLNCPNLKITGQFDLLAILKGDNSPTLIDIKTPATASRTWNLQTAAYQMLAQEYIDKSICPKRRICLMLPKNENNQLKIIEFEDYEKDKTLFLHALELYRFFNS